MFALAHFVIGLLVYVYTHEIEDLKEQLKGNDSRMARMEQTAADRGERIRALEDANTHLSSDMNRIGVQLDKLDEKLDRLIEQTMRQPNPRPN